MREIGKFDRYLIHVYQNGSLIKGEIYEDVMIDIVGDSICIIDKDDCCLAVFPAKYTIVLNQSITK